MKRGKPEILRITGERTVCGRIEYLPILLDYVIIKLFPQILFIIKMKKTGRRKKKVGSFSAQH